MTSVGTRTSSISKSDKRGAMVNDDDMEFQLASSSSSEDENLADIANQNESLKKENHAKSMRRRSIQLSESSSSEDEKLSNIAKRSTPLKNEKNIIPTRRRSNRLREKSNSNETSAITLSKESFNSEDKDDDKNQVEQPTRKKLNLRRRLRVPKDVNDKEDGCVLGKLGAASAPCCAGKRQKQRKSASNASKNIALLASEMNESEASSIIIKPRKKKKKVVDSDEDFSADNICNEDDSSLSQSSNRSSSDNSSYLDVGDVFTDDNLSDASSNHEPITCCTSTVDEITHEALPAKHVCWIAPDGKNKQCFALETLRRVASSLGKNQFLQPPHFRESISEDLKQQIVQKFGKDALLVWKINTDSSIVFYTENGEETSFRDMFDEYMQHCMGSADLYCCPLCYTEANRQIILSEISDFDEGEDFNIDLEIERGVFDTFKNDPMFVLGSIDNEQMLAASTFCFRTISDVKNHLRNTHMIQVDDLDGNSLFHRFRIRTGDGLLQRYLEKSQAKYQGSMQRYWRNYNQDFVLLKYLAETPHPLMVSRNEFSASFSERAYQMWSVISSPYLKLGDDEGSFFASDEEVVCVPTFQAEIFDVEKDIVEELRNRHSQGNDESFDEKSDSYSLSVRSTNGPDIEEDESSEDEWILKKRSSLLNRLKCKSANNRNRETRTFDSGNEGDKGSDEDSESDFSKESKIIQKRGVQVSMCAQGDSSESDEDFFSRRGTNLLQNDLVGSNVPKLKSKKMIYLSDDD